MGIGRVFWKVTRAARAARFWLLLALAALAWLGVGESIAAENTYNHCPSTSKCPREVALAKCVERGEWQAGVDPNNYGNPAWHRCVYLANPGAYRYDNNYRGLGNWSTGHTGDVFHFDDCPAGQIWNDSAGQKRCMQSCTSRGEPTFTPNFPTMIPNGSVGCSDGCEYMQSSNGDGTYTRFFMGDSSIYHCSVIPNQCSGNGPGYTMNYGLNMCVPPVAECAPNEVKDPHTGMCTQGCPAGSVMSATGLCEPDAPHCPAGMIRSPEGNCLPGAGQCYSTEVLKPDGTCGLDSDGDGIPDEFDPDADSTSFTGGDTCAAPPSCSGDAIMCGQSRIQWRIECNTRDDAIVSGGMCGAMPSCTGPNCKAQEHAQLIQQWKAACALEKIASDNFGSQGGDGEGTTEGYDPTADAVAVVDGTAGEGEFGDAFTDQSGNNGGEGGAPGGTGELDSSGLGFSRSCPNLPSISVFGGTLDFNAVAGDSMCDWFRLGGHIVLILAALVSLRILSSSSGV